MDEAQLIAARRAMSERTVDGKKLSFADSARMVEEEFDQSGLGDLLEKMPMLTEQEKINRALIGKRIVAVSWIPIPGFRFRFRLESITLEGGVRLEMCSGSSETILARIEESKDDNT